MHVPSLQAGVFPSVLRGVPGPQGHGGQPASEPGASSVQPGQLRGSGLHVELGAASSVQSGGVYSAGRAIVGRGPAPACNLTFDF